MTPWTQVHPVNWEARWKEPLPVSRSHTGMMEYIQTPPVDFDEMWDRLKGDLRYCEDSRVWSPIGREIDGKFYTANSLRVGFHAQRLSTARTICEIGAGFGALARARDGWAHYQLIDHPRMIELQQGYLAEHGLTATGTWLDVMGSVDLAVAINSITETDPRHFYDKVKSSWFYVAGQDHRGLNVFDAPGWDIHDEWTWGEGDRKGRARLLRKRFN